MKFLKNPVNPNDVQRNLTFATTQHGYSIDDHFTGTPITPWQLTIAVGIAFILLFLTFFIVIGVNNRVVLFPFDDRCHNEPSFLFLQIKRLQPFVKRLLGNSYGVTNSYALKKVFRNEVVSRVGADA